LSQHEIASLSQLAAATDEEGKQRLQETFRRAMLTRVQSYLESGSSDFAPYYDQRTPVTLHTESASLLDRTPFLAARLPAFAEHLSAYPIKPAEGVDSFLYWSKEKLGGKPMLSITHMFIVRSNAPDLPDALVASRQVYANHYMTGSLAFTAVFGRRDGVPGYLAYLNRSRIDVLGGLFGPVARLFIERRLRNEAALVVDELRMRLEGPPSLPSAPPPAPPS
jgi:hypothetical protein